MKPISTRTHGVLDYVTAAALFMLSSLLGRDARVTRRVRLAAAGTALYSLVTQYERGFGPPKVLPMRGHLALDGASGALFRAAPLLLPDEPQGLQNLLVGVGVFEMLMTLNTQVGPGGV